MITNPKYKVGDIVRTPLNRRRYVVQEVQGVIHSGGGIISNVYYYELREIGKNNRLCFGESDLELIRKASVYKRI